AALLTTPSALAFDVARAADCSHSSLRRWLIRSVAPRTKPLIAALRSSLLGSASIRKLTISACTKLAKVSSSQLANWASDGRPQNTMPPPSSRLRRQPSQLQNFETAPTRNHLIRCGSFVPGGSRRRIAFSSLVRFNSASVTAYASLMACALPSAANASASLQPFSIVFARSARILLSTLSRSIVIACHPRSSGPRERRHWHRAAFALAQSHPSALV